MKRPRRAAPAHTWRDGRVEVGYRYTSVAEQCRRSGRASLADPATGEALAPSDNITIKTVNGIDTSYCAGNWNGSQQWQLLPDNYPAGAS